ncbi:hypothetical protein [Janthinobacterium sp. 64]|uniref:hypothetical protein n=1 Tax=Janthinobacterium sp. 64 TaxID=2035208 RepID=UPI0012FDDA1F|nr:hypothetical protein [Janthinobacterium sp. 64]
MRKLFIGYAFSALLLGNSVVYAQETESVQTVEVKSIRVRFVSYKESYALAKKVQIATSGRVAMGLMFTPAKPGVQINDIQLWLDGEQSSTPIKVTKGIFVVPVNDEVAEQNGSYSINKQKGELNVRITVLPAIANNAWTIGKVRQSIIDATNAIDKFTPWYQKPFAMKVNSVGVCSSEAGAPVKLMNGDVVVTALVTSEKNTDDSGHQVYCQSFASDAKYDDNLRIDIPDNAQVLFL